jgi:pyrroloquinoline quinone biosynthesis protein D
MNVKSEFRRPVLVRHARYRWDELRRQHQLLYPEGLLVLNESGAAIVRLCDGRALDELVADISRQFTGTLAPDTIARDVNEFLEHLARKGLLRDADS